ncbi:MULTISPECIES: hypothetical protein [unclassified Breznakia]|uniref:hypothetical protein n=1 Tax=unclassified Breznakia TaxID=2623764 RepID=UPI002473BA94|nr:MULTISPECIES: hypothetical protein [unclassified Breznakia]MDH6367380.1 hypothetical protein [Breznakia sp. PH1-1]MDH6403912.1 hypothetical protein [Breznakia sp. PF1-11]MDH6411621.1 hypothetical protein [Breznakia sp. PFB1-11]MDH6414547.1 hypothetical protein [Breznakia sp. PFB1-14]MDH6418653.1 hypothetical protein [Breznakia sp. PFB1-12]
MNLYFTNVNNCSDLLFYLFDFKGSEINQCEVDNIPVFVVDDFERVVTAKLNKDNLVTGVDYNGVACLMNSELENRQLFAEIEDGSINSIYLTSEQLGNIDQLIDFEILKDKMLFDELAYEINTQLTNLLDHDKREKVLISYASNYYNEETFANDLHSFLSSDKAKEVLILINDIETNAYENFEFDEIAKEHFIQIDEQEQGQEL